MEQVWSGLALVAIMLAYLGFGVWIFSALILVGVTGLYVFAGFPLERIGVVLQPILWRSSSAWELAALPLFIWMGEIVFRTDVSERLFRGLAPFVHWIPGRLLHTNVAGCTLFAAVCGSSAATTATVGKITTRALADRKYPVGLALGSLAGAGSLGLLIPPSIVMIIYGVLAEVSIARLFIAGFLPGFLVAGLYSLYIVAVSLLKPALIPDSGERFTWRDRLDGLSDLVPILLLIAIVLGSIYSGIATPTEAAAVGVVATIVVTGATGQLRWPVLAASMISTVKLSCMICSLLIAASFLATAMGYLHLPSDVAQAIAALELGPYGVIVMLSLLYIVLGCFLDGISMVVLTLSVTLPLATGAGFDPVWFGIFLVIMVELAQVTPPVGFNLYVLQSLTGYPIGFVARSALPFFFLMCLAAAILTIYPEIVLFLPRVLLG
jgi:tripartite ATP-independent transporter DctM subunit